jgi:hypothetical protein
VVIRMMRTSPPNFMKWLPDRRLIESATVTEYGSYGAPRPLPALLTRTSPPGIVIPEEAPWPAMPVLATDPLRLRLKVSKPAGAMAPMVLGAAL